MAAEAPVHCARVKEMAAKAALMRSRNSLGTALIGFAPLTPTWLGPTITSLSGMTIGQTIAHDHVLDKLGEGGMGVVYRAEDVGLARQVAVKFLPPELSRDVHAADRFEREARAASSLNHPHICTVHDLKPANVVVTSRRPREGARLRPAKLMERSAEAPARAGRRRGSSARTGDESRHDAGDHRVYVAGAGTGRRAGFRTDLVGVVLYEMATGVPLFNGGTSVIVEAILNKMPKTGG